MLQHDKRPEAIIWDLDGTLVESAPDLATALNALLYEQGQHGHPVDQVRPMIGGGVAKLIERGFRAAGAPLDDEGRDVLIPRFMEIYSECCTQSTFLKPHARDALLHFYNADIPQGLCTNKPQMMTEKILHALDISGFFDSIVGGDSTPRKKPHPLPLLSCLEELRVSPNQAIMIGDSAADVGAARNAGVAIILVPGGYSAEPAVSLGADFVVDKLGQIPGWLAGNEPWLRSA